MGVSREVDRGDKLGIGQGFRRDGLVAAQIDFWNSINKDLKNKGAHKGHPYRFKMERE